MRTDIVSAYMSTYHVAISGTKHESIRVAIESFMSTDNDAD